MTTLADLWHALCSTPTDTTLHAAIEEYASENDEEPDIKAICEEATKHSQGYLLLPAGEFCGHPIGRLWTTNGYLQCEKYVTLDATHPSLAYAADTLLRAVTTEDEE